MRILHDHEHRAVPWRVGNLRRRGMLYSSNVSISPRLSRVRLKVIVFKDGPSLVRFFNWIGRKRESPPDGLAPTGCVNYCATDHVHFRKGKGKDPVTIRKVDPRFFAVLGLVAGTLDLEVLAHECVHVAEAYSMRFPYLEWPNQKRVPSEALCYPAGILTKYLHAVLANFIEPPAGFVRAPGPAYPHWKNQPAPPKAKTRGQKKHSR